MPDLLAVLGKLKGKPKNDDDAPPDSSAEPDDDDTQDEKIGMVFDAIKDDDKDGFVAAMKALLGEE